MSNPVRHIDPLGLDVNPTWNVLYPSHFNTQPSYEQKRQDCMAYCFVEEIALCTPHSLAGLGVGGGLGTLAGSLAGPAGVEPGRALGGALGGLAGAELCKHFIIPKTNCMERCMDDPESCGK